MSFRVGTRVKRVVTGQSESDALTPIPLGSTAVVTGSDKEFTYVKWDSPALSRNSGGFFHYTLAPAVDSGAEQFIERMKRLGREPAPIVAKGVKV